MTRAITLGILLSMAVRCESRQPVNSYVTAAQTFTKNYSQSRLARWNVRATAVGADCKVLLVETKILLEDSLVEAMHYGAGAYDVQGGVDTFYRARDFRGVAYKDRSGKIWAYGNVRASEVVLMKPCH